MPSAHVPGTVMFGSQYQPYQTYGSFPQMIAPNPVAMQYGQPTAMPVAGSVAGGVIAQPIQTGTGTLQLNGTTTVNGMTYQPYQTGMVYTNGMAYQQGMVAPAGAMGPYSSQPVILTGYTNGYFDPVTTTNVQSGRRGLFGRLRR
jgi:hypothetical protein